ncbi:MAG: hypothetical protein EOP37_18235 [Rubrivivax sp.]|nr:MAG: hypothetical protein EOP37_18235 [Rubrivivax sp.]
MVPLRADGERAPRPTGLPSLIELLMGLGDWPQDHGILVRSTRHHAPLAYARIATSRHVVEILFDPETGRYVCTNCQSTGFDLPASVETASEGSFVGAVIRGLTAAAATTLLQGASAVLALWPDGAQSVDIDLLPSEGDRLDASAHPVRRKPAL